MSKLVGFRGRYAQDAAERRSAYATPLPHTLRLADGSYVGRGDTILSADGTRDVMLYGARDSSMWLSEATDAGLVGEE